MQVIIEVGSLQQYALEQCAASANALRPIGDDGQPVGSALTAESYLQARVSDMLSDYCRQHCRISGAAFIDRFTAAEWAALKDARTANQQLAAAAAPLLQGQRVELAGPLAQSGVALLVSLGLLTQLRAAEVLAPPSPAEAA